MSMKDRVSRHRAYDRLVNDVGHEHALNRAYATKEKPLHGPGSACPIDMCEACLKEDVAQDPDGLND